MLDIGQARLLLELIFAAFERAMAAIDEGDERKPESAVDHAGMLKLIGERSRIVFAYELHDLVGGQRTGTARLIHRPAASAHRDDRGNEGERQQPAQR